MKHTLIMLILLSFSLLFAISSLRVGYYDNPPKIYYDELTNKAEGFWAEVTNEIGKDAKIEIIWVYGTWLECNERLNSGAIDVMLDVAELDSRKNKKIFNNEMVLLSWSTIFTHKNNDVASLLDFQNHTMGVLSGSVNYNEPGGIVELLNGFNINVEYIEFDSYINLLDAVVEGEVYGGVASKDIGNMYKKRGRITATPFWFQPIHLKYALSINNPLAEEIISILDNYIVKYKMDTNSIYYLSISKYIDKNNPNYFPKWVKILLIILSLSIIGFYLFNRILAARVKSQTQYLIQEIAEKEKTQRNLEITKDKLRNMNKIKDNFLRSVSHELLTPLNSILGFSDLLLKRKIEYNIDLQDDYLKSIHYSGEKLLKIVNDMIDVTLINSKLVSISHDEVNIFNFLVKLFEDTPKSESLNYSLQTPTDCDRLLTITTDHDKLKKILSHLLDNANKVTDYGEISLGYNITEDDIVFFVKDTGIGFNEKDKDIIFHGFTQLENNKDKLSQGSGLGLTIVYALVASLEGEIWVKSSLNEGTTFYVKLPLKLTNHKEFE